MSKITLKEYIKLYNIKVDYELKRKVINENTRLSLINSYSNNGNIKPRYNKNACEFFKLLNVKYNLKGKHAEGGGKHYVKNLGYWLDYYEPTLNLVIEWNEEKHYSRNRLVDWHKKRQNNIKKILKCNFFNIREKMFNEKSIFLKIKNIIKNRRLIWV